MTTTFTLIFLPGNSQFLAYPCSPCAEQSEHKLHLCQQANEIGGLASLNKCRNHAIILRIVSCFKQRFLDHHSKPQTTNWAGELERSMR